MKKRIHSQGFTLIEVLLVMVIISSFIYMGIGYLQQRTQQMRIDRTVVQMQQILNAGLSYYVANGKWPLESGSSSLLSANILQTSGKYLPTTLASPYGSASPYVIRTSFEGGLFSVSMALPDTISNASAIATVIAGSLPLASSGTMAAIGYYVQASVNIPGQNLNNATAITFAGLYHHGACIPVPVCPVDATGTTMTPQVFVVPVSVSGVNDPGTGNVYPISSFTAYAKGSATGGVSPELCNTTMTPSGMDANCAQTSSGPISGASTDTTASANYWRACMQLITEMGDVSATNDAWGSKVTMAVFTRCSIVKEPSGSTFSVFGN